MNNHEHDFREFRRSGRRYRLQCFTCLKVTPWKKDDPPPQGSAPDLGQMTVPEIRALCKERGYTGYSKMNRSQLVQLVGSSK